MATLENSRLEKVVVMEERLFKKIVEAKYLTETKADRYRPIIRYCFEQYERTNHHLSPEEILEALKESPYFRDYTIDELQADLNQLCQWNNLTYRQDTSKARTIEEIRNKRFRYMLTPYTVHIERMVKELEQIDQGYHGSLDRSLCDRLYENFRILTKYEMNEHKKTYFIQSQSNEKVRDLWSHVYKDFKEITQQANDYLSYLNSKDLDELMYSEKLLNFRKRLIEYLRDFVLKMQYIAERIEAIIREEIDEDFVALLVDKFTKHELSTIVGLESDPTQEMIEEKVRSRWSELTSWFLQGKSGYSFMLDQTDEIIRRIYRLAQRLSESRGDIQNRKQEYLTLAKWFHEAESIEEAHVLSAYAFATFDSRHIWAPSPKASDSIYMDVWDEQPYDFYIIPREYSYSRSRKNTMIRSYANEQKEIQEANRKQRERQQQLIEDLIHDKKITFATLPTLPPYIRKVLLGWIGRCTQNPNWTAKMDTGHRFQLKKMDDSSIFLECEDGVLEMPNFVLYLIKEGEDYGEASG